jgi:hypothetical protein
MKIQDLDRIRFVTQRFGDLQGLRHLVPLGLLFLSGAGAAWLASWPLVLLQAVSFFGAFALMLGARRYYRSTFGEVERPRVRPAAKVYSLSILSTAGPAPQIEPALPVSQRCMLALALIPPILLLFTFLFWPPWIAMRSGVIVDPEWHNMLTFSLLKTVVAQMIYPLCGSFFLGIWWLRQRRLSQSYHLAMGVLLSGLFIFQPMAVHLGAALLLCGSSLVLAGLLDHLQLVRVLGRREGK